MLSNRRYKIDFTPLYQASEVYKSLGIYDQFQKYYRENRKVDSRLNVYEIQKVTSQEYIESIE